MPRLPASRIASLGLGLLAVATATAGATPFTVCDSTVPTLGADGTATVVCEPDYGAGAAAAQITVPAGITRIDVTVRGGGGAAGGTPQNVGYNGGSGAQVVASLSPSVPSSLATVTALAGSGGASKGSLSGGGGGGFSAIYEGAGADPARVIIVAGGGGGGGYGTKAAGCSPGRGGEGGLPSGAGGNGEGGDTPGTGGGLGVGGGGGTVPFGLTGTGGATGVAWMAGGGLGGVATNARGGDGGAGHGGGGSGGFVNTASAISGCPSATDDGSGGGAGGSYAKTDRLLSGTTAAYDNSGGTGGDPSSINGTDGSVVLTFVATVYIVTYDGNGATGGQVPTDHRGSYLDGQTVTVCDNHRTDLTCTFPNDDRLTRAGYTFDGWNTAADGSGTRYAPTSTFAISANTVLYAQWKASPATTSPAQGTPAAPVAPPLATLPAVTTPPALRGASVRCTGAACTTTGTLPAGATRVSQTATSGGRALSLGPAREMAATARGTCRVKTTRKGKAVRRTYTCRIRLAKGTWAIATKALSPTGTVVAQAATVARVK